MQPNNTGRFAATTTGGAEGTSGKGAGAPWGMEVGND